MHSWQFEIKNDKQTKVVTGDINQLPDQTLMLSLINKDKQDDALQLTFKDTWYASVQLTGGDSIDLSQFMSTGTLSFDIRLDDMHNAALDLKMSCGDDCETSVRLREWALEQDPSQWNRLVIPLNCFTQQDGEFNAVTHPFTLVSGGKGTLSLANIELNKSAEANFNCEDLSEVSTTPAMLNEYWAVNWWLPRHQEKLTQLTPDVELLMIGDSITHGWEDAGKAVWEKEFSNINTINLGFGGDRTENVLWRLEHGAIDNISPKLAVVMIGTNNTGHRLDPPQEIYQGVAAIVSKLNQTLPSTQVVLLSIFPRSEKTTDKLRINNDQTNLLLANLVKHHKVEIIDINHDFLDKNGQLSTSIMPDLLHPNEQGYEIWAQHLQAIFAKYLTAK
ncbi:GDSL-type esterase/lipase family protein [Paraglaciecola aquimarina]|uniref:GDSL-type esterase/lipase family protein n=1 Tax=Paraglaciecola algarum TaxID=3050085 RepID=A0ABS9D9C6_9ALTE|nr:putative glycoside hydrolase [Paraglaciecola sp. G1-23]MCF2949563.1 GDSL-type esterase/lipase family protein [Paraglaciecola sp. G1-23]